MTTKIAEALYQGSENLDKWGKIIDFTVSKVMELFAELQLGGEEYWKAQPDEYTWWEVDARVLLSVRCISRHPSVCVQKPTIIFTSNPKWLNGGRLGRQNSGVYELETGMRGRRLVYDALDDFLEEAFRRWFPLWSYLNPMLCAGGYNKI